MVALIAKRLGRTEVSVEDRLITLRKQNGGVYLRQRNRPTFAMLKSKPLFDRQRAMPKNCNKPWTPEDDKRLLELKVAGKSHGAIGVALGRSTGSIVGRLSLLSTRSRSTKSCDPDDG